MDQVVLGLVVEVRTRSMNTARWTKRNAFFAVQVLMVLVIIAHSRNINMVAGQISVCIVVQQTQVRVVIALMANTKSNLRAT